MVDVARTVEVEHIRRDLTLDFQPGSPKLSAAAAARLGTVVAESGGPDGLHASVGLAVGDPLASQRFVAVVRELRRHGVIATAGGPPAARDQANIEFGRYVAHPQPCPATTYNNLAADSLLTVRAQGCTTANNLAAMVADPGDLVTSRGHGPFDGVPAAAAVSRYRDDKTIPLIVTEGLPVSSGPAAQPQNNGSPSGGAGSGP
jgi:pilus assembly protein CpaD